MIGAWCLTDLHDQFGGELTSDKAFSGVSTDTRNICAGDLFVALRGPNFDAHEFIEQALENGAVAVVVDHQVQIDVPQWIVPDTRIALGDAKEFHSVLLSDVPQMKRTTDDQARRFINLVDEFYDRNVKLIISAEAGISELYLGGTLSFEFDRTVSRLLEMQSHEYLAREHRP